MPGSLPLNAEACWPKDVGIVALEKKKKVKEIFNIYLFLKYILKLIESSYIEEISKVKLEPSISALGFVITIIIQTVLIFL